MNNAYRRIISVLIEVRNPNKELSIAHTANILRRLGKMSVNPSQRVKRRAARAEVQLAKQVRSKFLAPGEHGTVADNVKGMVYRKFAAPEHEAGEDEELKRQSKLN